MQAWEHIHTVMIDRQCKADWDAPARKMCTNFISLCADGCPEYKAAQHDSGHLPAPATQMTGMLRSLQAASKAICTENLKTSGWRWLSKRASDDTKDDPARMAA